MNPKAKPRLLDTLAIIDGLRYDLHIAAPDDEQDILNTLNRQLQIAEGIVLSAITEMKMMPMGAD